MNKFISTRLISLIMTLAMPICCIGITGCGKGAIKALPEHRSAASEEADDENIRTTLSRDGYTLEQAVVLSRHNIRAPLSGAGSALDTITPHTWFNWSAEASQLSVRGGTLETEMGQYFRKWLESEGLFAPNYQPADGAVRIYANSKQRTIATSRFFAAGLLPVPDKEKAAFGHDLFDEQWEAISKIKDVYGDVLFTVPSVAVNVAHPLLEEMEKELQTEGRQFTFLCGHDSNLASVLAALEAEDYSLPGTIEKKTPIGAKLVISKWKSDSGEEMISLDMVYQTTDQLREMPLLEEGNPPAIYSLKLKGLLANEYGMYEAEEIMKRLDEAIKAYDDLQENYEQQGAAA